MPLASTDSSNNSRVGFLIVALVLGGVFGSVARAQHQVTNKLFSPNAEGPGEFGDAVAEVGDIDGDGTSDLLVGAPGETAGNSSGAGQAYLLSGSDGSLIQRLDSPNRQKGGHFGYAVAGVGDANGDGTSDLLIGAPDEGSSSTEAGRAYLLSGATGDRLRTLSTLHPEDEGEFGGAVAGLGDVSGDGTPDLLVGAPDESVGTSSDAGRAYVYSGATGSRLRTLSAPTPLGEEDFGYAVAAVGDIDGDGTADVLIGDRFAGPSDKGEAYLFSGSSGSRLRTVTSPNPESAGRFGDDVAGAPDANGDGTPDLVVGALREGGKDVGRAYLLSGSDGSVIQTLTSPNPVKQGHFGDAVAGIGDANGDGTPDLLVGAFQESVGRTPITDAGKAYLISGADGSALQTLTSPKAQEPGRFGRAVAGVGDVSGDAVPDLLVGASNETVNGRRRAGRAYLLSGATGTLLRTFTPPSPAKGGFFGTAVTGIGDTDGDGTPDLLISAPGISPSGTSRSGRVYLFSGATGNRLQTITSPSQTSNQQFGNSIAGVGDINGDAVSDFLIGAQYESVSGRNFAGRAYLFSGATGSRLQTLTSPNAEKNGFFGSAVAGVGDTDGDGTPDVLVGALSETANAVSNAGRAYLFSGATGSRLQTLTSPNAESGGSFGEAVAEAKDANGDGTPDLLIGASFEDANGLSAAGRAYLFSGSNGGRLQTLTSPSPVKSGHFGEAVAGTGDINGDGASDVLVGAGQFTGRLPGNTTGRAYLLSGADGSELQTLKSRRPNPAGEFGKAVAKVRDIDGDKIPDLLIGAPGETLGFETAPDDPIIGAGRTYLFASGSQHVFTVDVTGDSSDANAGNGICATRSGDCSLRAAIQEANARTNEEEADEIRFDIPGSGPHTIRPQSALPDVIDPVLIDGSTEPDFSGDPVVAVDGSNLPSGTNLLNLETGSGSIGKGGSFVLHLSLFNSPSIGVFIRSDNNTVYGCWVGLAPDGTVRGNGSWGIRVFGSANIIGDPDGRENVIVGSSAAGIDLSNSGPGNGVGSNFIGETPSGKAAGNRVGITIGSGGGGIDNSISQGNLIAHNSTAGVVVQNGRDNKIRRNQIFDNGGPGIDLANDGQTPNDATPADSMDDDDGVNHLQNFPVIKNSSYDAGANEVTVTYEVPSKPGLSGSGASSYPLKVDFYKAGAKNEEGKRFLHTDRYKASDFNGGPAKTITFTPPSGVSLARSDHVVATATDSAGNTSEFTGTSNQLPVELASLEAKVIGEGAVRLTWQTAAEKDNAGFAVQRRRASAEDSSWLQVGFVEGAGTSSSSRSYRFEDTSPPYEADTLAYRLRQVDKNGSVSYSRTVTVDRTVETAELLGTYPNPARHHATLRYAVPGRQEAKIHLYDVLGRRVRILVDGVRGGRQRVRIELSGLPSGVYFLRLRTEGTVRTQRLTVVR